MKTSNKTKNKKSTKKNKVSKTTRNKKIINYLIGVVLALFIIGGVLLMSEKVENEKNIAVFETSLGEFKIRLYEDLPITTGNFKKLVEDGFYDGLIFHRVIDNFMIQAGCPNGIGSGGPGYNIEDEFVKGYSNVRGTISMANTGRPNSGGSQFFINLVDNKYLDWDNDSTPSAHPVFGEVIEGMDVVDKIGKVQVGPGDRPVTQVTMKRIYLE